MLYGQGFPLDMQTWTYAIPIALRKGVRIWINDHKRGFDNLLRRLLTMKQEAKAVQHLGQHQGNFSVLQHERGGCQL